jgi:hypothetical protein
MSEEDLRRYVDGGGILGAMGRELLELRALRNAVLAWDGRSLHVGSGDCIRPSCAICRLDKAIAAERARLGEGGG